MKVEEILRTKGASVFAISGEASIRDAINVLSEKNIGAVVVSDGAGGAAGILSERDVVRRLNNEGAAVLDAKVSVCMTPSPFTCSLDTSVDDVMGQMTEKRIRHMPVVKDGALVGVVSIGDVVKRKIDTAEQEAAALKEYISS